MAAIGYSVFLQALGWAALNSLWQAGLLWCIFLGINYLFKLSSERKYIVSVTFLTVSFVLFCCNIIYFLQFGTSFYLHFIQSETASLSGWLPTILTSASITYLLLLIFPVWRLLESWCYIKSLQQHTRQKVCIEYKLYIKKMAELLGIKKSVSLYISDFVHSPLTIGYLKPIILLPVAALNHLTLPQAEAVLLHELAHIRRYDYLVNFFISVIQTLLYFNPFVKLFARMADASREECCDQMVLQFGYDKISYASALLNLEKASLQNPVFALGATGKSNLQQRIEKIVGLAVRRQIFKFSHIVGFFATLMVALLMQAFFTSAPQKEKDKQFAYNNFVYPPYFSVSEEKLPEEATNASNSTPIAKLKKVVKHNNKKPLPHVNLLYTIEKTVPVDVIPVALTEADAGLTSEQKKQVESTISLLKKVLTTNHWNNLESSIPDGLTKSERAMVRMEYLKDFNKINWKNLEDNLKADYNNINWREINASLVDALKNKYTDSLINSHKATIEYIENIQHKNVDIVLAFPDESVSKIHQLKDSLCRKLDSIQIRQPEKKIIRL